VLIPDLSRQASLDVLGPHASRSVRVHPGAMWSCLSFPLNASGSMLGIVSFDSIDGERTWPDELGQRLLGEVSENILSRRWSENGGAPPREDLTPIARVSTSGELHDSLADELNQPWPRS
jgi:hypothetical protein